MGEQLIPRLTPEQDLPYTTLKDKQDKGGSFSGEERRYFTVLARKDTGAALTESEKLTLEKINQKASGEI